MNLFEFKAYFLIYFFILHDNTFYMHKEFYLDKDLIIQLQQEQLGELQELIEVYRKKDETTDKMLENQANMITLLQGHVLELKNVLHQINANNSEPPADEIEISEPMKT